MFVTKGVRNLKCRLAPAKSLVQKQACACQTYAQTTRLRLRKADKKDVECSFTHFIESVNPHPPHMRRKYCFVHVAYHFLYRFGRFPM